VPVLFSIVSKDESTHKEELDVAKAPERWTDENLFASDLVQVIVSINQCFR
jgi:hypothetical protein